MELDVSVCAMWACQMLVLLQQVYWVHGSHPVVRTDKGRVRGKTHYVHGHHVDVYYGIPYARPPTGDLRFVQPQQTDPWTHIHDATQLPNCCMQVKDTTFGNFSGSNVWNPNTNISEDCLYLNVWAPRSRSPRGHKAVLVWVYGGAYISGSSVLDIYDAKFLAAEFDVVVVSMQFRVGSSGYFVLGPPHSPGNAGMMDLRMSLEWVQRNIHQFGGNAHNVTLCGESSGAASVGLLMMSSLGRGLFHRAILQSAGPQAGWATVTLKEGRRRSLNLARTLGCDTSKSDIAILRCLRKIPASRFPKEEGKVSDGIAQFPFVPVIDGTFLAKSPTEYLREGEFKKIPLLLGGTSHEGSWLVVYASPAHFNLDTPSLISPEMHRNLTDHFFRYYPQFPSELNHLGLEAIRFQYTDWLDPTNQSRLRSSIVDAVGDAHFTCAVTRLAQVYAAHDQDVYLYRFSHRMSNSPWPEWMGVLHGDEIFFVFGRPLVKSLGYTREEKKLSRKVMRMWTNFAKTGNPNRGPGEIDSKMWPKFREHKQLYLDINLDLVNHKGPTVGEGLNTKQCAFWNNYLPKVAEKGSPSLNSSCGPMVLRVSSAEPESARSSSTLLFLTSVVVLLRLWVDRIGL